MARAVARAAREPGVIHTPFHFYFRTVSQTVAVVAQLGIAEGATTDFATTRRPRLAAILRIAAAGRGTEALKVKITHNSRQHSVDYDGAYHFDGTRCQNQTTR